MGGDSSLAAIGSRHRESTDLESIEGKSNPLILAENKSDLPSSDQPEPISQFSKERMDQLLLGACQFIRLCQRPLSPEERLQKLIDQNPLPDTAMDKMREAIRELAQNNFNLSPEIDKKFKAALEDADGPSSFSESLKLLAPEIQELQISMDTDSQALSDLDAKYQEKVDSANLSPHNRSKLETLIEHRKLLEIQLRSIEGQDLKPLAGHFRMTQSVLNRQIDLILPGTSRIIDSYFKQEDLINKKYVLANQVIQKVLEDSERSSKVRWAYAIALEQAGDNKGAAQQIINAAAKDQKLLENEEFIEQALRLGLDYSKLKVDES